MRFSMRTFWPQASLLIFLAITWISASPAFAQELTCEQATAALAEARALTVEVCGQYGEGSSECQAAKEYENDAYVQKVMICSMEPLCKVMDDVVRGVVIGVVCIIILDLIL